MAKRLLEQCEELAQKLNVPWWSTDLAAWEKQSTEKLNWAAQKIGSRQDLVCRVRNCEYGGVVLSAMW